MLFREVGDWANAYFNQSLCESYSERLMFGRMVIWINSWVGTIQRNWWLGEWFFEWITEWMLVRDIGDWAIVCLNLTKWQWMAIVLQSSQVYRVRRLACNNSQRNVWLDERLSESNIERKWISAIQEDNNTYVYMLTKWKCGWVTRVREIGDLANDLFNQLLNGYNYVKMNRPYSRR
jgi:hypothetical protein